MSETSHAVLATCSPYRPGYGFRAELWSMVLPSGRAVYRLMSWDARLDGPTHADLMAHFNGDGDPDFNGPTLRAECDQDDYRQGTPIKSDAHLACALCHYWSAYADRPDEFGRDADADSGHVEQHHRKWWRRWDGTGGGLTGEDDAGDPDTWTCEEWQPAQEEEG